MMYIIKRGEKKIYEKKIDLYLENLYLIKNMFEDDPIALPAIEELIEKAEHCKKDQI